MSAKKPQDIRNIALLGHGGAGKTILAEALLHAAGVTNRFGTIEDGTTVMDHTDLEKQSGHSVDPSIAHFDHNGKTINLIDAPGYPDFVGGAISALGGVDTAVIVISAHAGIEVNTRKLFSAAGQASLARAIVINKIDAENTDLPALLKAISETFGSAVKCMNLPTDGGKKVIDCFGNDSGSSDIGDVGDAHTQLVESVIEADEEMMEAYLGGEEIPADKLGGAFAGAMTSGTLIPLFFTAGREQVGVAELIDAIAKYFPSPADATPRQVRSGAGPDAEAVEITAETDKPLVAQAFRTTADPFVGKLSWIRILQGKITGESTFSIRDERKTLKAGHVLKVRGAESAEVSTAVAGDIVALAKIEEIRAGDILHAESGPMFADIPAAPTPMYSLAVAPKSRGDEGKISEALSRLAEEDSTFRVVRDNQTNETVISGIGDLHIRMMLKKMSSRFNLEVETKPPKIPYRESITATADGHYRHKKQTGGAGQFGEVYLRVEPLEQGSGFEFDQELFGESIPRQYLPAIEKGVRDMVVSGVVAGYPMQDLKVVITDGKHHPVDSKEVAFRTAGKFAFIDAVQKAKAVLLEPIVTMEITVPSQYMGDIAGDLSSRRGRILGQDMLPGGIVSISAQAPLAEVVQYNSQLRSVTGGQGSYTMEFSHYDPVPGNVQQQIIANAQKAKEQEK
ncbi:MAG: elongation factor G [Planctomycetota bacterium]|nr:elongation factor G [Planctomycetota bacterium]